MLGAGADPQRTDAAVAGADGVAREIARMTRSWSAATAASNRRPAQSIASMRIRRCARMRPIASVWVALVDQASASPRCCATVTWPETWRSALYFRSILSTRPSDENASRSR